MKRRKVHRQPDEIGNQLAQRSDLVKNCKVCKLGYPLLGMVNRNIINGAPYMDVFRDLNKMQVSGNLNMEAPSYQSIRNHAQKHLNMHDSAIRRHLELRAIERNMDVEQGVQNILTDIAAVENVLIASHQALLDGKMMFKPKDILDAAKMKREFDFQDADADEAADIRAQMDLILQAIKSVCDEKTMELIAAKVDELARENDPNYDKNEISIPEE